MVRLSFSSDDVRNCKETTFVKERKKCSVWRINKDFYLKNPKSPAILEQVKLVKLLEKYLKIEVIINFK